MKKKNLVAAIVGQPMARITRAQAVACHASSGIAPSALKQHDQKRVLRTNAKRTALDEGKNSAAATGDAQNKKRAVLNDVTNVCCDSYKSCLTAGKLSRKIGKQARKPSVNASKIGPSPSFQLQQLPAGSKTKAGKENEKTDLKPAEVECSVKLECKIPRQTELTVKCCTMDNPQLDDRYREMPSQIQTFSKGANTFVLCGKLIASTNPDVLDIDSDNKDSQSCSLYAPEIYSNLRVAELIRRPHTDFMETVQYDITKSMRRILVEWLVEVSEEYKLVSNTLYLTVHLIDLFLSQNCIDRQRLQLLGITCMLIASKYEEICAPRVEELCFITDNTYTREEVIKMESEVLNYLNFQLSAPTSKMFLRRYLRAAQASYKSPNLELEFLANYLAELTLVDYEFLKFLPSTIAASTVFLAKWTLDQSRHPWNATLEHYTSYKASDLKGAVLALRDLQLNTSGCPKNAICAKYKEEKFKSVAALSSPELLHTLF